MRRIFLACTLLSACSSVPRSPAPGREGPARPELAIVEAPRPNSGHHTPEQARQELMALLPTMPAVPRTHPLVAGWQGPSPGFHAHVDGQGALTINGVAADLGELDATRQRALNLVDSVTISVLLTSEASPGDPQLQRVLEVLFEPGVQLYVVKSP